MRLLLSIDSELYLCIFINNKLIDMAAYIFLVLYIINFIIGTYGFFWAWKKVKPVRNADEKRDSQYPSFRRLDLKNWNALRFYIGAVTVMPIRFCIALGVIFSLFVLVK